MWTPPVYSVQVPGLAAADVAVQLPADDTASARPPCRYRNWCSWTKGKSMMRYLPPKGRQAWPSRQSVRTVCCPARRQAAWRCTLSSCSLQLLFRCLFFLPGLGIYTFTAQEDRAESGDADRGGMFFSMRRDGLHHHRSGIAEAVSAVGGIVRIEHRDILSTSRDAHPIVFISIG